MLQNSCTSCTLLHSPSSHSSLYSSNLALKKKKKEGRRQGKRKEGERRRGEERTEKLPISHILQNCNLVMKYFCCQWRYKTSNVKYSVTSWPPPGRKEAHSKSFNFFFFCILFFFSNVMSHQQIIYFPHTISDN